eukprot:scaffold7425_cov363-Prasinococcus_capsulatus_cf.AAC.3
MGAAVRSTRWGGEGRALMSPQVRPPPLDRSAAADEGARGDVRRAVAQVYRGRLHAREGPLAAGDVLSRSRAK